MALKVGDRVRCKVHYGMEGGGSLPAEEGTVVYVHPQGRFYTVEFIFPQKDGRVERFRESYWPRISPPDLVPQGRPRGIGFE